MGLALEARHVQGLFLLPMTLDRGWTRESDERPPVRRAAPLHDGVVT